MKSKKNSDSDPNKESEDEIKEPVDLEKITRTVLLIGILFVSIGIIYFLTEPEEEYSIFILLNDDEVMGNYPVNASVNENVSLHTYIESHYSEKTEYMVKMYRGNNDTTINSMNGTKNVLYLGNFTIELKNEQNWTSHVINVSFPSLGSNQTAIFELWRKVDGEWQYIPNHILFVRIEVLNET